MSPVARAWTGAASTGASRSRAGRSRAGRRLLELCSAVRGAVIVGTGPTVVSELAVRTDLTDGRPVEVVTESIDLHYALRTVWTSGRIPIGPPAELLGVARGQ